MVRVQGARGNARLSGRIRRGEIGGVILFPQEAPLSAVKALVTRLQRQARQGGAPPLLVAIDQEGGPVKRLAGPPSYSAPELGAANDSSLAREQGRATGRFLASLGINVDLAPVVDVPRSRKSFIRDRAYGTDPALVSRLATAFASGMRSVGVAATAKHFPGLGRSSATTDSSSVVIGASRSSLQADLVPFRSMVAEGVPMVMTSTAVYPAYDRRHPAAWSREIVRGQLRRRLGFRGVVLTDDLASGAVRSVTTPDDAAVRAADSDIVLFARPGSEPFSERAYAALLDAAATGRISQGSLQASYRRVLRLKTLLAKHVRER
jgi:beta-N-acetylhexosaminidase